MADGDADTLGQYIVDANFPCSKQDLVQKAQDKGATEGVMKLLQNLPDKEYQSAQDVTSAVTTEQAV